MHASRQISPRSPQHHVEVIGHHREGIKVPAGPKRGFVHRRQEGAGRTAIGEDIGSVITPRIDMQDGVGAFGARRAGHALMIG